LKVLKAKLKTLMKGVTPYTIAGSHMYVFEDDKDREKATKWILDTFVNALEEGFLKKTKGLKEETLMRKMLNGDHMTKIKDLLG